MLWYNFRDQNGLIYNLITAGVQSSIHCDFGLTFQEHKGLSIVAIQGSTFLQPDQVWKFFCRSSYRVTVLSKTST